MHKVYKQLGICVLMALIHVLTLAWYISGILYPGVYLIGIEAGIAAVIEIVLCISSLRNYGSVGVHWNTVLLTVLSILSALFSGYCFLIWFLFFL